MPSYSPAWPHGPLVEAFPDVYYVVGTNKTRHDGFDIQTSRTMTVLRDGTGLTLINTVRLDDAGLRGLAALGEVRHVVRLGAFHGRDDAFYCDRHGATLWALPAAVPTATRTLAEGGPFPVAACDPFVFTSARFPEAAVVLARAGGILITCDAIQNWTRVDEFFSRECGEQFTAQGLIRAANIPSTWLGACQPSVSDFHRLLTRPFRHLISGHGEPLRDEARAHRAARVAEVFAG